MSTYTRRIAHLAGRSGMSYLRVAGAARLGLAGTIRHVGPIPVSLSAKVDARLKEEFSISNIEVLLEELNRADVWVWCERRQADGSYRPSGYGHLTESAEAKNGGQYIRNDEVAGLRFVLATTKLSITGVPSYDGQSLYVLSVTRPRKSHTASLLVGNFVSETVPAFDMQGFCVMVGNQTELRASVDSRSVEFETREDRAFITSVRRHLETLRDYAQSRVPQAEYELVERIPIRLRTANGDAWPKAFTRPGMFLLAPTVDGRTRNLTVVDVSDEGDVLTANLLGNSDALCESGLLVVKPAEDAINRMREALDAIAQGEEPSHLHLIDALTRPESLAPIPGPHEPTCEEQYKRQVQAKELALNTPDIALIHGPPGTGKTRVIGEIIRELVACGKRVLLVAPTHVALDNVLERVGNDDGIFAIRLGSPENVEEKAHKFLLEHRRMGLTHRLSKQIRDKTASKPDDDAIAVVQRDWAERLEKDEGVGTLLLLNANLLCATPIGIAMAREFRDVEAIFDVMIMDEASKATITDFLVPAARAKKWILVGDHRQLAPYVDLGELEAVVFQRAISAGIPEPDEKWAKELSSKLRWHFDNRMHPDKGRIDWAWSKLIETLTRPFNLSVAEHDDLLKHDVNAKVWRNEYSLASKSLGATELTPYLKALRLGAEIIELRELALPSVFEHLTRLPDSRSVKLNYQHRMAPSLAEFSSQHVYDGDYPSAPGMQQLESMPIPGLESSSVWINTQYAPIHRRYEFSPESNKSDANEWSGGNYSNELEVQIAAELVEVCARWAEHSWYGDSRTSGRGTGASFEIGVTAFYLAQAHRLRDEIFGNLTEGQDRWSRRWKTPAANGAHIDIHVSIVDRFQGREKDVIILSATRSNPVGKRGHVDNLNRLNVALTRARGKRIIIGDVSTLVRKGRDGKPSKTDLLGSLLEASEEKVKWGRFLGGGK